MKKNIFIIVGVLLLLTTLGVSAQQFVQAITLKSGEMVQIICEGDEPEFLVNIKGNSNYTRCISVAPSPTTTPTVEATPTSPPTATGTPTSPVTPLPSVTLPVTVNVAILEASSGSAMLNANNWSSVQTGVVNEAGEYSNCRFVGATDGLRVYCQFWTPVVAGDSAKIFINNVPIELNWPTTNGWEIAERCSAVDCRGWTAFKRFDWDVFGGKPADGVLWPLKVDYKNYTWDGVLRWGFPNYNGTPGFVKTDVLADAASIGGGTDCGDDDILDGYFPTWGSLNRGLYGQQPTVLSTIPWLNTQMQWDVADWPCYSAGLVKWQIPTEITLENLEKVSLSLYRFGHSGYNPGDTETTTVEASIISPDWDRGTVVWNTAPASQENISRVAVTECITGCGNWFSLDVTEAVRRALQNGERKAAVKIWTNAGNYHSGKYFNNSGGVNGPFVSFETGKFPTPTPVPPTPTLIPPTLTPTPIPPTPTPQPTAVPILDNFNRADGPIGGLWQGSSTGAFAISNNQLFAVSNAPFPIIWSGQQFTSTQEASVKIVTLPTSGEVGLILKADATVPTRAINVAYQVGAKSVVVFLKNQSWSDGVRVNVVFDNGDVMGAKAYPDGAVQILKNGVVVGTANISSWPFNAQGGYIGVYVWFGAGAILDDFDGGGATISPALPTPTPTPTTPVLPTVTPSPTSPLPTVTPSPVGTGRTFYVSLKGNDANNGLSLDKAFATFSRSWSAMQPGDTLLIDDGYYYEPIHPTVEGLPGKYITIKALNDGKVTIDGRGVVSPVKLGDVWPGPMNEWYVLEGVVLRNGTDGTLNIWGNNIIVRRVSAYEASPRLNSAIVVVKWSENVLLEDIVASGQGRKNVLVFTSKNVTVRRAFTQWVNWNNGDANACANGWPAGNGINPYNSQNVIVENSIVTGPLADAGIRITINDISVYSPGMRVLGSIAVGAGVNPDGTQHEYIFNPNNEPYNCPLPPGSPPYYASPWGFGVYGQGDAPSPVFADIVSDGNAGWGFASIKPFGAGVSNGILDHATIINNNKFPYQPNEKNVQGVYTGFTVTNSYIPGFQNGEGARLRNRYVDGVLTNEPLWPWPMESRVQAEMGISVTQFASKYVK